MYLCTHRGTYCAVASAILTNIMSPDFISNTVQWMSSYMYQTSEGCFSAVPGTEVHGGYTFCGFVTLALLQKTKLVSMKSLMMCVYVCVCVCACMYVSEGEGAREGEGKRERE